MQERGGGGETGSRRYCPGIEETRFPSRVSIMRCLKLLDKGREEEEREVGSRNANVAILLLLLFLRSTSFRSEMEIDFPRICTPIASVARDTIYRWIRCSISRDARFTRVNGSGECELIHDTRNKFADFNRTLRDIVNTFPRRILEQRFFSNE